RILKRSTDTTAKSIGFGVLATTVMQSSSLVSVLTISFLGAGLIGLAQGIGIVFGANIGTTTGAWLVAGFGLKVKISAYAMPMLVFGIILVFQKSKSLKGIGYILAGLGFLFLGIHYMKDGFEAFKDTIDLASFGGTGLKYLFIFTGIGIFATVVMQSSHATLVLIITALSVGQISYENALALAIGANVGTTITAIIGSMSSNIIGKRLAGAHLIFNVTTGLIAIIFMSQIMYSVDIVSAFVGIASDDWTLKLAVFHTIFNVIGVVVMVPFINKLVVFLESNLKDTSAKEIQSYDTAQYLNESVLELPGTAMAAILNETKHLYTNAFEIITHGVNLKRTNIISNMELEDVVKENYSSSVVDIDEFYLHRIKGIYGEIIDFATKAQSTMESEDIQKLYNVKLAARDIVEAIKDTKHLQKNFIKYDKSENLHIKEQYDSIKIGLAKLLRNVDQISKMTEEDEILLLLSKAKVDMQRYDVLANGTLDNLIRNSLITNEMATSLMNDNSYAHDISRHFIAMAEVVFIDSSSDLGNFINEMSISDEEIDSILEKKDI
ncbi:MAG: Na/Pi symporter, partial [Campylobacterota bacterium]|nr:Na/Pi symporter [Campylobacterota bacterium]